MKYKFFGTPKMLVKTKKRVLFQGTIDFVPLFRFDENGEYVTEDIELIEKLKSRFDHIVLDNALELPVLNENVQDDNLPIDDSESEYESNVKLYKCKHCEFETVKKGELLVHYKSHKGR